MNHTATSPASVCPHWMLRSAALATLLLSTVVARADLAPTTAPSTQPGDVKLTELSNHVHVEIAGKPFTDYWFAERTDRKYTRPFFDPVLASDGVDVTSDQYVVPHGDHPHHQSLWVAHSEVNGVDHWDLTGWLVPPAKQRHLKFETLEGDRFVELLDWEAKERSKIVLHEKRTVVFGALADGTRTIDLTVALTPADEKVVLGDIKDAGLCAVRLSGALTGTERKPAPDEKVTNSRGAVGEPACWGKPAEWCDISGTIESKPYGIAIFDYPKNPRYPTTWHVRQYGLMAANPFARHDFDPKHVPAHTGDFTIEPGTTATFRYLVLVHTGDVTSAHLDDKYKVFAAE